jgi:hypothetical protein
MRNSHRIEVGTTGERLLGRPGLKWEGNIKMDFEEIGCEGVDCIYLAQGRVQWRYLVNAVMNLRVP